MIDERTARLLLGRLNQARWREAMARACARSWLDAAPLVSWRGVELTRFTRGAAVNEMAAVAAARREHDDQPDLLGLGASSMAVGQSGRPGVLDPGEEVDVDDAGFDAALSAAVRGESKTSSCDGAHAYQVVDHSDFEIEELVAAARSRAKPLKVEEVAGALLLANAVGALGVGLNIVLDALKGVRPIVVLVSPVIGFQVVFQRLMEDGLIPPGPYEFRSIASLERSKLSSARTTVRRSLVSIPITPDEPPSKWVLSKAFESHLPILIEAPSLDVIPQRLQDAATLILDTGPLDADVIKRMVEILRGVRPAATIGDEDCRSLDLVDLRMAFRPGLGPDEIIHTLRRYGRENRVEQNASVDDRPDRREPRSGSSFRARSSAPPSTIIEPSTDPAAPRVEALVGYGEALTWAEDLKLDLDDWREGRLVWADLSPRLLLSGPPGTGKTTWAKALGNSLQLPLLATSAADWLTGGHLGDVLAAMDRAFADAVRRAPCILFIDEVDGIGTRERPVRDPDDYWTSVVNKALQLMDGANRTEGVVLIGATNRPEALDPALRRAGRLERHIAIPKPDTATLAAILAHHLGEDLARMGESDKTTGEAAR